MIISRDAALARLHSPDNPFSPSKKDSEDWGRAGVERHDPPTESNEPEPLSPPDPTVAEIKSILSAVDPSSVRDRRKTLQGNIPAQAAVGETALIVGAKTAGALFDRSLVQTQAYEHGHGAWNQMVGAEKQPPKPQLVERLSAFKEKLAYAAGRVLETSLDNLDAEKIARLKKATSISRVAKDMAVIMDKCTDSGGEAQSVHFHIYRPDMRSVGNYDRVNINSGTSVRADIIDAPSISSEEERPT